VGAPASQAWDDVTLANAWMSRLTTWLRPMTDTAPDNKIPCPYVYAKGKRCTGHIVGIEAYRADLSRSLEGDKWMFSAGHPRSHYHLVCSEKGNHAGSVRIDSDQMKFWLDKLPEALRKVIGISP
jgi:hypothetical protein